MSDIQRRDFLKLSGGGVAALTIGFSLPGCSRPEDPFAPDLDNPDEVNAWLTVSADDSVVIRVSKAEMGQGVQTALAMIVADELECRWEDVRVEAADVNRSLRNGRLYGNFLTDGSSSVRGSRRLLQRVGANARTRLIAAAAEQWNVSTQSCQARQGRVHHMQSGRSKSFGELVSAAAEIDIVPVDLQIKAPAEARLLGQPLHRLDVPDKVTGKTVFGIDVVVPGMRHAAVLHAPTVGGTLRGIRGGISSIGSVDLIELDDAVAAIGNSFWEAQRALDEIEVEWHNPYPEGTSTADIQAGLFERLESPGTAVIDRGASAAVLESAESVLEATYDVPYLAHACMEPLNCTASVTDDRVEVWVGTQNPEAVVALARSFSGLGPSQVHVHQMPLGGGFGRRISTDYVLQALQIARKAGTPIKMIWTREQDTRRGYYRPMAVWSIRASYAVAGSSSAMKLRSVTDSIFLRHRPEDLNEGVDPTSVMGLHDLPYHWDNLQVETVNAETPISTWMWRSVGDSLNAFPIESFVDELAVHAGSDPVAIRRRLLVDSPRHLAVLNALHERIDVTEDAPPHHGRGLAIHENANTIVGQVVEIRVSPGGDVEVLRVVSVVDCGNVVNPLTIEEQIEGAVVFGLSAALYGQIKVENGAVREGNFDTYRILRITECPSIETYLAPTGGDTWGGVGEPGVPPVAPALCNAIYQATGKRIRSLPVKNHDLSWQQQI